MSEHTKRKQENEMNYDVLFTPFKIGRMEVKNRIVMSPMGTLMANRDGRNQEVEEVEDWKKR